MVHGQESAHHTARPGIPAAAAGGRGVPVSGVRQVVLAGAVSLLVAWNLVLALIGSYLQRVKIVLMSMYEPACSTLDL